MTTENNTTPDGATYDPETGEIIPPMDLSCVSDWDDPAPAPEGDLSTLKTCMATLALEIPPVVALPPQYPFIGKGAVKKILAEESPRGERVRTIVVALMVHLQTEDEQTARDTKHKNKRGLMSSHAWHGTRIGRALAEGTPLSALEPEDQDRVSKYGRVYSKQVAAALRAHAVACEPELGISAGAFFGA